MKIKLLVAFMAIALVSCSKDDDSGSGNSGNGEKKLNRIIQTDFNENGSVKMTSQIQFDDNNKALSTLEYDGDGVLSTKRDFTYNKSGQVETMMYYTAATGIEIPNYSYTVTYKGDGRVESVSDSFISNGAAATSSMDYVYNENSTIVMTRNFSFGGATITTFYLDTAGSVYKKTDSAGTAEQLIYAGKDVQKYSTEMFSSTFAYDNEHTPKGQQNNVVLNQYNGNVQNTLLLGGFTSFNLGNTKYVIQRTDNGADAYNYEYQFDDEGYPVKVKCYKNKNVLPFSIREIYYR